MQRRAFLKSAAVPVAIAALPSFLQSQEAPPADRVILAGDGLLLTPPEYARVLTAIAERSGFKGDNYLHGGAVEELEKRFAELLGKESARFLPTGTLANHLAVRVLAGDHRRVIVQHESHLYRDESDGAQLLSGLNLMPLGPGQTTITLEEITKTVEQALAPPYPGPVGAISIESPVRRTKGGVFDFDEMKKISAYAREKQIGTHLDGARVFIASAYTGIPVAQYAALFDTVYVSLYKYFNAPFGAVLAGPRALLDRVAALRHVFGSEIYQGWHSAAVALHYLEGFPERFQTAVRNGEAFLKLLEADGRFRIERQKAGSNVFGLGLASGETLDAMRDKLGKAGIVMFGAKNAKQLTLQVNETINRRSPEQLAHAFRDALS